MITCKEFNTNGRIGNQLFVYASLLGIANKNNEELILPEWKYSDYFTGNFPVNKMVNNYITKEEEQFHYKEPNISYIDDININLKGYYQSEKYWEHCKDLVKNQLTFNEGFIEDTTSKFIDNSNIDNIRPQIGIHIRRGDYVNNSNYYQLPIHYYIQALFKHFEDWQNKYNLIFFSDDINYCKLHFNCLPNAYFAEGTDIEDLCLMSECDNLILSNSSYSWFGAYLGVEKEKVIRPNYLFDGELKEKNDDKDFWIKAWIVFDHKDKKIDLKDTTFTIPTFYDHSDRKQNLQLCIETLQKDFNTNIIVNENKTNKLNLFASTDYHYTNHEEFHRTKMLNIMALESKTPIIANWDCDIFIPPMQLIKSVQLIRDYISDMVYPYSKSFVRMKRKKWYHILNKTKDIGNFDYTEMQEDTSKNGTVSVGGAVIFNKNIFIAGGMENENFISFGPEDSERYERFKKLGARISRVFGNLYHLNHFIGVNSSKKNPYFQWNEFEFIKIKLMDKEELVEYIKTWKWIKKINN